MISLFNFLSYFVWLRITDNGSVPEMRIWSILLSLFSYCKSPGLLHSIFCELFAICPNHIFRFSREGGWTLKYLQVCAFTFVIKFRLLLSICGLHFWCPLNLKMLPTPLIAKVLQKLSEQVLTDASCTRNLTGYFYVLKLSIRSRH